MNNVRLVWITPDAEQLIAYMARVSNPENQDNPEYTKLIKYLIQNKHWSPFEMVNAVFEIKTSRAISAQIIRHRSFSFQEFCITGDSKITLQLPSGATYKRTIEHLYKLQSKPNQHIKQNGLPLARVFDGVGFTVGRIQEVINTGVKPVFEVCLADGKKVIATKEHKFLTKDGFDTLENIVGLSILGNTATMSKKGIIATNGISMHQSYDWLYEQKKQSILNRTGVQGIANNASVSYHTIRKWLKIHKLQFTKKETASCFTIWNKGKFGYKNKGHSIETLAKLRNSAKRGSDSNLWRGGVDRSERLKIADWCSGIRAEKLKEFNHMCTSCGSSKNLELDHIVPVYKNMDLAYDYTNIQVLCKNCHNKKHNLSGDQKIWRERSKGNTLTIQWVEIVSVKYIGKQQTYDLHVDHTSHNYVANGVVVHNSQRYSNVVDIEPIELRQQGKTNRQSSDSIIDPVIDNDFKASQLIEFVMQQTQALYKKLVENGVAKEIARMILPMASSTTIYMNGNLRSWIHYLGSRNDKHAQKEHRVIAQQIEQILRIHFPIVFAALDSL